MRCTPFRGRWRARGHQAQPLHRVQHLLRPRPYDQAAAPPVHFPHAEPAAQRRQRRHLLHSEHIQELANHARRQRGLWCRRNRGHGQIHAGDEE